MCVESSTAYLSWTRQSNKLAITEFRATTNTTDKIAILQTLYKDQRPISNAKTDADANSAAFKYKYRDKEYKETESEMERQTMTETKTETETETETTTDTRTEVKTENKT